MIEMYNVHIFIFKCQCFLSTHWKLVRYSVLLDLADFY